MDHLSRELRVVREDLSRAIRAEHRRRAHRRRVLRTIAGTTAAVVGLSGGAFAAGNQLGLITLGHGYTAKRVSALPPAVVKKAGAGGFAGDRYFYRIYGPARPSWSASPTPLRGERGR